MPTYTPYYNLAMYNNSSDTSETFAAFRAALCGVSNSNMIKLDNGLLAMQLAIADIPYGFYYVSAIETGTNAYQRLNLAGFTAYEEGQMILLNVSVDITGAATLDINSLGIRNLTKSAGDGSIIPLVSGDLVAGKQYMFMYTGTEWLLLSSRADIPTASTTAEGVSELATSAETTTGTDTGRTITPDALSHSNYGVRLVQIQVTDPNGDDVAVGDGKAYFRVPSYMNGYNLISVAGHVTTVSSSGLPTIQIHNVTDGQDMLSTRITIDENEKDSSTAATQPVINTSYDDVATADELRIDVDVAGTGTKGLIVELAFRLP